MFTLLVLITVIFALNGVLLQYLNWAFRSRLYAPHRFREPMKIRVPARKKAWNAVLNSALSTGLIYGVAIVGYDDLFSSGELSLFTLAWQPLVVLAIYDLFYYGLHRFIFHHKKLMKLVHGVHHRARYPSAQESLWLHPVETISGVALLFFTIWLLGPIHVYAFVLLLLVYTLANILIHSGIEFPRYPMRLFNPIARAHYGHHMLNVNRNFASITPFWDRLFRTTR